MIPGIWKYKQNVRVVYNMPICMYVSSLCVDAFIQHRLLNVNGRDNGKCSQKFMKCDFCLEIVCHPRRDKLQKISSI